VFNFTKAPKFNIEKYVVLFSREAQFCDAFRA
jgi:hypothetical protein